MNTTIVALQALYLKLGGSLTDTYDSIANGEEVGNYTTIPDMIEACAQKAGSGGGGSSLPAVTAEDNGSVLTVVEGEWDKALGGAGDFLVEFTIDLSQGEPSVTADHTIAEIFAAYQQGKNIKGVAETGETVTLFFFSSYMEENNDIILSFFAFGTEGGTIRLDGDSSGWNMTQLN